MASHVLLKQLDAFLPQDAALDPGHTISREVVVLLLPLLYERSRTVPWRFEAIVDLPEEEGHRCPQTHQARLQVYIEPHVSTLAWKGLKLVGCFQGQQVGMDQEPLLTPLHGV